MKAMMRLIKEGGVHMKRIISIMALLVFLTVMQFAAAEETNEYRDKIYAFRYPASWSCDTASNGDIVLGSPDGKNGVLTFAVVSDLVNFTGDEDADAENIRSYIADYGGRNLSLTGEYELIEAGEMKGFRAFGSWLATGQEAVMLVLTADRHLVGFVLVGEEALALEQSLLDSVELLGEEPAESAEGFLRWEGELFSLDYPENYGTMEQSTGVIFVDPQNTSCIIMARSYTLDFDYSDSSAPNIAAAALPKSANVEADPEMVEIGGKNAAVIQGTVSGGPMSFYVTGSGRTALALMFTGTEACGMAEHIIQSAEIK